MRVLIVAVNEDDHAPQRLFREALSAGHQAEIIEYRNLQLFLPEGRLINKGKLLDLDKFEALIMRSPRTSRSQYFGLYRWFLTKGEVGEIKVFNRRAMLFEDRLDKQNQAVYFAQFGIPHPDTRLYGSWSAYEQSSATMPIVLKTKEGSHGKGVHLVNNSQEAREIARANGGMSAVLFQRPIKGKDFRLIVLGSRVLGAMQRWPQEGKFVANIAAGGVGVRVELDKVKEELALKAAKVLSCEFAGVDLMETKTGGLTVLEVNQFAQFQGFEKATGVNVAKEIVRYLTSN